MMVFRNITVTRATPRDVDYVVRRMRDMDRREIFGARFSDDCESLINEIEFMDKAGLLPFHYAIGDKARPRAVSVLSLQLQGPHHGYVNMFATADFAGIVRDVTRFVRQHFIPDCVAAGLRRVELRTLASWIENRRWLESLGAELECIITGMGVEPYAQYAWMKGDVTHVLQT